MNREAVRDYVNQSDSVLDSSPQMDEANTKAAVLREKPTTEDTIHPVMTDRDEVFTPGEDGTLYLEFRDERVSESEFVKMPDPEQDDGLDINVEDTIEKNSDPDEL